MADAVPTTWEEVFKHDRFKQLNDAKKNAETELSTVKGELETIKTQLQTITNERDEMKTKLSDAQAGQTDLEKLQTELGDLTKKFEETQTELKGERFRNMQTKAAQEAGLPLNLATRLHGATLDELVQDAKDNFVSHLKPVTPGTPPVPPRTPPQQSFTSAQLSDPEFVRKNADKILSEGLPS